MLGRETAIQKLRMTEDGWFVIDHASGLPQEEVEAPALEGDYAEEKKVRYVFPERLPDKFQNLRIPLGRN